MIADFEGVKFPKPKLYQDIEMAIEALCSDLGTVHNITVNVTIQSRLHSSYIPVCLPESPVISQLKPNAIGQNEN